MENKVSVIVPVYNCEKYLEKCIQSIQMQSYQNLEIILVDDGSTDSSLSICQQAAAKDKRIVVIHQDNGGVSKARNAGLDVASGEYIGFVDSDDYIDEDMYEFLLRGFQKENIGISICGMYQVYANRQQVPKEYIQKVANRQEAIFMVLESRYISVNPVNRLFRRNIFDQLRFPVGMTSEDAYVILDILKQIEYVYIDLEPKYYYVHRLESITTRGYRDNDLCVIKAYERNHEIISQEYPELLKVADFRLYWSYFYVLDKMLEAESNPIDSGVKKKVVSFLRKNWFLIIRNPYVGRGRKIAMLGLKIHIKIYDMFLKKYRSKRKRL